MMAEKKTSSSSTSKPEPNPVPVRVVMTDGTQAVVIAVTDDGDQRRYRVHARAVSERDGQRFVEKSVLTPQREDGIKWEDVLKPSTTADDLARELRRRGLFGAVEVQTRPNEVIAAIQAAYGVDLAAVMQAARNKE